LVTLVLWVPDLLILHKGQPHAVAVLMLMHLAIALITYNLLVHVAPVVARRTGRGRGAHAADTTTATAAARSEATAP
jgi:hypothetical protein